MKDELSQTEIEYILEQMKSCKREHPKAKVYYDTVKRQVVISYPLPDDFMRIKDVKFNNIES